MPDEKPSNESWKHEPPYKIQPAGEFGHVYWRGRCQCGRVEYWLNMEKPLDAKFCHCRGCQVLHGAPFQWAAIFQKSAMTFRTSFDSLNFYNSAEKLRQHKPPCKVSCAHCHSPIMDEGRNTVLLFPEAIDFGHGAGQGKGHEREVRERRGLFAPSCHIFYSQRVIDIDDGKPKWSGMNDESERI
ncbi:hypothetical protein AJ80_03395 [Polytolypa hystricis UAMH7299]|uniref:CENP-V/GFA domain-containing protein n=1 Tax=Polytolypa hystricis (strain UAMH7299) TaxID=1447883 RepID=A0A2B7YBA7_POLH7|nr:hypothetical protein AJ80_03395 [Polytolypa hystricis UAMH7299]